MHITRNMVHFRQDPEDTSRIIVPSGRRDEIGTAERELGEMQRQLSGVLLQKTRLAQLGLAVSKINHDLRGMLANAQLLSDRLTAIPDPTVQRFAPKLIASLDRAINFCNDTLRFGRAEEAAPRRELLRLKPLVEEVGDALGLPREGCDRLGARHRRHAAHRRRPRASVPHREQPRAQRDRGDRRPARRRAGRRDPHQGVARWAPRAGGGARQRPRRAAEGARASVRGLHRLAAQGRHGARARDCGGDRRRSRRPSAALDTNKGAAFLFEIPDRGGHEAELTRARLAPASRSQCGRDDMAQ